MKNFHFFTKNKIQDPPYSYDFLLSLNEKDYPQYLKKLYEYNLGKKLNLKNPKSFNEKIQWLKLYNTTPLKTKLTDKVLVRDWIKEKIGAEYLKPVLQICSKFDDINFDKLPNSFIIKANHGCKWHYKIMDQKAFLKNKNLVNYIKRRFDGWMNQTFFPWAGFEMQYKNISPRILIEPLLINQKESYSTEFEIYCFNGEPKFFQKIKYTSPVSCCIWDENYNKASFCFNPEYNTYFENADGNLKNAVELSKLLAKDFILVRVDWLLYENKIYFNEMTFTPFSGFFPFENDYIDLFLGKLLNLK